MIVLSIDSESLSNFLISAIRDSSVINSSFKIVILLDEVFVS